MTTVNQAAFDGLSQELKTEFYTSFKESMEELEACFESLNMAYKEDAVHEMFRAIHSLKGNCHMVFLDEVAEVCHKVEDLVSLIRKGELEYSAQQGEFITFIMTRLEQLVVRFIQSEAVVADDIHVLIEGVDQVYNANNEARPSVIQRTLQSYSGLLTSSKSISQKVSDKLERQKQRSGFNEIAFMREVFESLQSKSILKRGDLDSVFALIKCLNRLSEKPEHDEQLLAAYCFIDIGNKFVSSPVFDVVPDSPGWEKQKAKEQLHLSAGFLKLGDKWLDAADIIDQSFERFDGRGLNQLLHDQVRSGAQVIALVRFYQYHYFRFLREHNQKISTAKALKLINSESGYRFCPKWVNKLTLLAKKQMSILML